ncbi:uncharacterized protein METZ01_LOCUS226276 [marine metagenome]|uniref:Uncharacterized protein n=1 Tax=marine metagenome TaxID=408172 RepID=A0A382GF07_9ZZZZ
MADGKTAMVHMFDIDMQRMVHDE